MNRSEQINEIATALAKAQGAMESAKKDSENPHFRSSYASLASVWDACRVPLAQNGLSVTQLPDDAERGISIETVLMHTSGQWISSKFNVPLSKIDAQGVGSALTYGRRYALSAILGIAADDDDGNAAAGNGEKPVKEKTAGQLKGPFSHGIPKEQHDREEAAKDAAKAAAKPNPAGQQDKAPFRDKVKSGRILKEGVNSKTGVPWTLYEIEFVSNGSWTTFSHTVNKTGELAYTDDSDVMVHFEMTNDGPRISEIEILQGEAPKVPNPKSKAA